MIEVVLDKTAAPAEVQAVKQAFEDAGLLAEVSADLEHASATLPPMGDLRDCRHSKPVL